MHHTILFLGKSTYVLMGALKNEESVDVEGIHMKFFFVMSNFFLFFVSIQLVRSEI